MVVLKCAQIYQITYLNSCRCGFRYQYCCYGYYYYFQMNQVFISIAILGNHETQ